MAETKLLHVTITRVDGPLFDDQAQLVTVPGADGEMTILAHHEPFISPLKAGTVRLKRTDGTEESFPVESGTVEVSNNRATVLI